MNQMVPVQEGAPARRMVAPVADVIPVLDTARFEHMQRIATVIARSNMVPETLCMEGQFDKKQSLPFDVVMANVFLVVNQAVRWGMDPFAVLQQAAVVHGKLCYEGKLVAAVLEAKLGVELDPVWNDKAGDAFGITITGRLPSGKVREVSGTVGEWKTTGKNSPWGNPRRQLLYRGTREWARWWAPGLLLGVYTDDELTDLQDNARAQRAMPVPSQQEQVLQLAAQPKATTRRQPPAPEPDEAKPAERKAEAVTEAKPTQQRRAPPQPEPEDATDWQAELRGYGDALSGVEAHEELAEVIEAHGSAFADAPAEIRAAAAKLEEERRDAIGEDTTDQGDNPHDRLIQRLRSEVMDGKRVVALLNALPAAEREMVSEEDRKMLTAAQKAVEAQAKGGGN